MPRLLSGIKSTGDIHIGNYFGAMKQFLDLQNTHESFLFVADLHALNQVHDPAVMRRLTPEIVAAYLAVGLDPEKVTFFRQSEIPAHAELTWILNCITSMGLLERAHAYKDAQAKEKAVNVGLFDYPVLMAADILLYRPEVVPVGKDQQQHVEITIDIAERFHHLFGETFVIPKPLISEATGTVPGTDGRKMSKSYGNVIGLFDPAEVVAKKVMGIVTDSAGPSDPKDPDRCTIFALHRLFSVTDLPELEKRYREGSITYKESKELLADSINALLEPIRTRRAELDRRPEYILEVLEKGRFRAEEVASATLADVKRAVGLL